MVIDLTKYATLLRKFSFVECKTEWKLRKFSFVECKTKWQLNEIHKAFCLMKIINEPLELETGMEI
jgi:hypothetical protein